MNMSEKEPLIDCKRLVMITVKFCDFCKYNKDEETSLYYYESNSLYGWQVCEECYPKINNMVILKNQSMNDLMMMSTRRQLYLEIDFDKVKERNILIDKSNYIGNSSINLKSKYLKDKCNMNENKFYIGAGRYLRMSESLNELIWIEGQTNIYVLFKNLIKENPEIFGKTFEDSIFKIDTKIHRDLTDKLFWKNILDNCY
jgi:hypothetical protein